MNLPENIANALSPLFAALPRQQAMDQLVPGEGDSAELVQLVEGVVGNEAISVNQPLVAALWLYIDELDRSHRVSQGIEDQTGSFWHGIMHRREGDFSNSHYWFRKVGRHPAMADVADYDARTPLHLACLVGHAEVAKLLLRRPFPTVAKLVHAMCMRNGVLGRVCKADRYTFDDPPPPMISTVQARFGRSMFLHICVCCLFSDRPVFSLAGAARS